LAVSGFVLLRRLAMTVVVFFTAATLNFFLPRFSGTDPITDRLGKMSESGTGVSSEAFKAMVEGYNERFGLGKPLIQQFLNYLADIAHFDFGYSISAFPARVGDIIGAALPWTIGLLLTTTLISFVIGSALGALAVWRRSSALFQIAMPVFMVLAALPFYLLGLLLIYFLAFRWRLFPTGGAHDRLFPPEWSFEFAGDVLYHAVLPGLSIVLSAAGSWALSMRGMMITVQGEDYMTFARARGLNPVRMFLSYGVRNAILPQFTTLALSLGQLITGAVLVEIVFGYPGIGNLLLTAVQSSDYFVIYGIVLTLVLTVCVATLLMELTYPILDPRARA
jgi:peptide/nickel transport system permease protein